MSSRAYLLALPLTMTCLVGGTSIAADTASEVQATWQRYTEVCARALSDPQAYINGLSANYQSGQYGTSASPDGQIFRATVVENGFFDMVEIAAVDTFYSVSCSTYRNTLEGTAVQIAAAAETILKSNDKLTYVGGKVPELYAEWNTQGPLLQNEENFQFHVLRVFPEMDIMTFIQTVPGYISVAGSKSIGP